MCIVQSEGVLVLVGQKLMVIGAFRESGIRI